MIRVKSAPANIAEMVNRRKIITEKKTEKSKVIIVFLPKKETIVSLKNQINIERIFIVGKPSFPLRPHPLYFSNI